MESFLKLLEQLQGMSDSLSELQLKLENAEAELVAEKKLSFDEGFGSGKVEGDGEGYARGFEDGARSLPPPVEPPVSDKIYSQIELDDAIRNSVEPLNLRISELESAVAGFPEVIENAKREVKAEIMSKYLEAQASESESEKGFEEFLK